MRRIHLHGSLATFADHVDLDVATAGEAVRALEINFPGFLEAIKNGEWHVMRGDPVTGVSLDEVDIAGFNLGEADLHFIPAIAGSKSGGGTLKVLIGVAIVGAAFFFTGGLATPLLSAGGLLGGGFATNAAMMGLSLAVAGVSMMLAPDTASKKDTQSSFTFNGPGNAYEQGGPVPVVYGEVITGGVMVSGGLDIEKIAVGS